MKLHRLELTNFRGIAHRRIDFPDRGVVVVCGPNEIGKSSMIDALDLLLEEKDRSAKAKVRQVKPQGSDVASEVLAEISTGKYRFIYRKRFHKNQLTELNILAPSAEQLTADPAHERVLAMIAETMDVGLWKAQQVLQADSTAAVELTGCDALSRALDIAAGEATTPSGVETSLIGNINLEFAKYFTGTGRDGRDWKEVQADLTRAQRELGDCQRDVDAVEELVSRHAELTEQRTAAADQRRAAAHRHAIAKKAADELEALTVQLDNAQVAADAARKGSDAATARNDERIRLIAEVAKRREAVTALGEALAVAAEAQKAAEIAAGTAEGAAQQSAKATALAQEHEERARKTVDAVAAGAKLEAIDSAQTELTSITVELDGIALTAELMTAITEAATAVQRHEDQLSQSAGAVEFTAAADIELVVGGRRVVMTAGDSWRTSTSEPTSVELPGVLTARIDPGATTAEIQDKLDAARQDVRELLASAGVDDVRAARELEQRRQMLTIRRGELNAQLAGLCGGEDVGALRPRLAALRAELPSGTDLGPEAAEAEHAAAVAALGPARDKAKAERKIADDAAAVSTVEATEVKLSQERLRGAEAELAADAALLAKQRAEAGDESLAAALTADAEALRSADDVVSGLVEERAARNPGAIEAETATAGSELDRLNSHYAGIERELNEITGALEMAGTEGRRGKLDDAKTAMEYARRTHEQWGRRARAVELLKSVMERHRDDTRKRYVDPFRATLENLGKPVFGPTFQIEIDTDLSIVTRTLDGCTVAYESLSGGAKEQLGILVRLAGAALVADHETVPVVIDDALGFADPDRLDAMRKVLGNLGGEGQVIVLTCTPDRYVGIDGAKFIELS
jgi:hypothetical protein